MNLVESLRATGPYVLESASFEGLRRQDLGDPLLSLVVACAGEETSVEQVVGLLDRCREVLPAIPVVVVSEESSPQKLIRWLKSGAADCLSAPVDRDRLLFLFESLTINKRTASAKVSGSGKWYGPDASDRVCCASPQMAVLISQLEQLASQQTNVMLVGETGTGKTRLARLLHEASPRRREPFVAVNCAAMPTTLLESELFGHRRGAFTGADSNHIGKFAHVKGGTLLLDEVDTLSLEAQAKLLRTVDDRVFEPLGSNRSEKFHGRLVVATNQNLLKCVDAGEFRADLYYRLNVVELCVPPLRERKAEILEIATESVARQARKNGIEPRLLSPEVRELLETYHWPGNIRELQNAMERAMTFTHGSTIRLNDLPPYLLGARELGNESEQLLRFDGAESEKLSSQPGAAPTLARARAEGEKCRLIEVLKKHNDNRSQAAKELGISRTALYKRLNKLGLVHFSVS